MFWFLKKRQFPTGLLPDPRLPEEKEKDYLTSEILTAQPLTWLDFEQWKNLPEIQKMLNEIPVYDQNGSSSCVAMSIALIATINNWKEEGKAIKFSARGIYARRQNKPQQGMWYQNGAELFRTYGVVPEPILPSQNLGEDAMNRLDDYLPSYDLIGRIYAPKNYFWVNSFDEVVQVISRRIPVQIGVRFTDGEWDFVVPQIRVQATSLFDLKYGHSISVMPNSYFTYQGKRAVLIQDSWNVSRGWNGRRILTEDWFKFPRFVGGIWYEDMNNLSVFNQNLPKPKYKFTRQLAVGMRGEDVAMLQVCLATLQDSQGYLFPLWSGTPSTGYYGGLTKKAVERFQAMYGSEQTGNVNQPTLQKLNEVFG
jgi:hypothetical protein